MTSLYRRARTRASLLAALLLAAFAAALFLAQPAAAHDELVSSNPADGAVLEEAPAQIELVFSSELMDLGNQVIVADADGNNLAEAEPVLNRETLSQAVPALEAGDYQVNWRAVSADGHPITGTFGFTVNAPAGAETTAAAPAPAETSSPAAGETAPASPEAVTSEAASSESWTEHFPWALAGAAVGAAAAVAAWVIVAAKKRRSPRA